MQRTKTYCERLSHTGLTHKGPTQKGPTHTGPSHEGTIYTCSSGFYERVSFRGLYRKIMRSIGMSLNFRAFRKEHHKQISTTLISRYIVNTLVNEGRISEVCFFAKSFQKKNAMKSLADVGFPAWSV